MNHWIIEDTSHFLVFPSWSQFSYSWHQIPTMLDRFQKGEAVDPNTECWLRQIGNWPPLLPTWMMYSGLWDGGIVEFQTASQEVAVTFRDVFSAEVEFSKPRGILRCEKRIPDVSILLPRGDLGLSLGKQIQTYDCRSTIEHSDGIGNEMWWCFESRRKLKQAMLNYVVDGTAIFGIEIVICDGIPRALEELVTQWETPRRPLGSFSWFQIVGDRRDIGWYFACLNYISLHLSQLTKKSINASHLVASIPGSPNFRARWTS